MSSTTRVISDLPIPVRLKLAGLWTSVLFCYVYGDFLGFFKTGKLERMIAGYGPFGPTSQESLLAVAVMMAVPCVVIGLSLILAPTVSRWLNIVVASVFIVIVAITLRNGAWSFYIFLSAVEILLKATIIWCAWTWRQAGVERVTRPNNSFERSSDT